MTTKPTPVRSHDLIFSLGPVQEFVAEARRTRDLWAGSFLLSYLTGLAMVTVVDGGGEIATPLVDQDPLYEAIRAHAPRSRSADGKGGSSTPYQPSLTNHFTAAVPADFDPDLCRVAILAGWRRIADAVWTELVDPALPDGDRERVKAIWKYQIPCDDGADPDPLWEVLWVHGPRPAMEGRPWLERRKTWRGLPVGDFDGGDHCVMMSRFREISGIARERDRQGQKRFWAEFRDRLARGLGEGTDRDGDLLEIRPDERLSAVALVKRLFPRLKAGTLQGVIGWCPDLRPSDAGGAGTRSRVSVGFRPSTAAVAVTHWLAGASQEAPLEVLAFQEACESGAVGLPLRVAERHRRCSALDGAVGRDLDGKLFYRAYLDLADRRLRDQDPARREPGMYDPRGLARLLEKIERAEREDGTTLGSPSPYYAMLMADGDHAGRILTDSDLARRRAFVEALAAFSIQATAVTAAHNGELIYAGGDDVLAMFPLEDAPAAARALRDTYATCVTAVPGKPPTLSVAIVFAHFQVELTDVLEQVRRLLDGVAKKGNGRDSLAMQIVRTGGLGALWVSSWRMPRGEATDSLTEICGDRTLRNLGSNRSVYGILERVPGLFAERGRPDGSHENPVFDMRRTDHVTALFDLVRSLVGPEDRDAMAAARLQALLGPLVCCCRSDEENGVIAHPAPSADGLLLLKFLVAEWRRPTPVVVTEEDA